MAPLRPLGLLVAILAVPAAGAAQDASATMPAERIGVAIVANVALEGSGPWFAPGVRLSVPLRKRWAFDIEPSRVFGGRLPPPAGSITEFVAINLRRQTGEPRVDIRRYWMYGLRYTPIHWPDDRPRRYQDDVALTIGHGWDHVFAGGRRVAAEIGLSGGNGVLLFTTIVVGFPVTR